MRLFGRRKPKPDMAEQMRLYVTNGIAHAFIPGDPEYQAEMAREEQAWWDSMTPAEQEAHLRWEQEETDKWLRWAQAHS